MAALHHLAQLLRRRPAVAADPPVLPPPPRLTLPHLVLWLLLAVACGTLAHYGVGDLVVYALVYGSLLLSVYQRRGPHDPGPSRP
jgi:hypothetical protein